MVLYVELNANWPDNPKVIRAGLEGAGLHAMAMCIAKRLDTDGLVDRAVLYRLGANDGLIDRLCELDLFDAEGDAVRVHNWLRRNRSQAAIAAIQASKRKAARLGNHRRWAHEGDFEVCEICNPPGSDDEEDPRSSQDAIAPDRTVIANPSPETATETDSAAATCDSVPATTPDLRRERLAAAARIMAERVAEQRGNVGAGWVHNAALGKESDYRIVAYETLLAEPNLTAEQLADRLEPPKVEPVNTSSFIAPVEDLWRDLERTNEPPEAKQAAIQATRAELAASHPDVFEPGPA